MDHHATRGDAPRQDQARDQSLRFPGLGLSRGHRSVSRGRIAGLVLGLLAGAVVVLVPGLASAQCAVSYTAGALKLHKPASDCYGWDTDYNSNWDQLDATFGGLTISSATLAAGLAAETSRATTVEQGIAVSTGDLYTQLHSTASALTNETLARASADATLTAAVNSTGSALTTESVTRAAADATLTSAVNSTGSALTSEISRATAREQAIANSTGTIYASQLQDEATISALGVSTNAAPGTGSCTLPQVVSGLNAHGAPTCAQPTNSTGNSATATALASAGSAASSGFLCRGVDASGNCLPAATDSTTFGTASSTQPYQSGAANLAFSAKASTGFNNDITTLNTAKYIPQPFTFGASVTVNASSLAINWGASPQVTGNIYLNSHSGLNGGIYYYQAEAAKAYTGWYNNAIFAISDGGVNFPALTVDPVNKLVGIGKWTPLVAADFVGDEALSGNLTVGSTVTVKGVASAYSFTVLSTASPNGYDVVVSSQNGTQKFSIRGDGLESVGPGSRLVIGTTQTANNYAFEVSTNNVNVTKADFYVDTANHAVVIGRQSSESGTSTGFFINSRFGGNNYFFDGNGAGTGHYMEVNGSNLGIGTNAPCSTCTVEIAGNLSVTKNGNFASLTTTGTISSAGTLLLVQGSSVSVSRSWSVTGSTISLGNFPMTDDFSVVFDTWVGGGSNGVPLVAFSADFSSGTWIFEPTWYQVGATTSTMRFQFNGDGASNYSAYGQNVTGNGPWFNNFSNYCYWADNGTYGGFGTSTTRPTKMRMTLMTSGGFGTGYQADFSGEGQMYNSSLGVQQGVYSKCAYSGSARISTITFFLKDATSGALFNGRMKIWRSN